MLDALQFASGLIPTAEPKDIRLVRPGRNGKPSSIYKVDLEAIQEKGDVRTNYQLFPGDRLIVGRNEVVKKTVEIDRLNAPIQAIVSSIQQNANMLKSLGVVRRSRVTRSSRTWSTSGRRKSRDKGTQVRRADTARDPAAESAGAALGPTRHEVGRSALTPAAASLVSGANGRASSPSRKTPHMVMPGVSHGGSG